MPSTRRFTIRVLSRWAPDELDGIEIEVSILTPARPIASPDDFIIGEHGIILQCRGRSAVFLPQVAPEQDWDREETLTHLCYKAGLPFKTWQADDAELSVFTAIVFSEKGTERNMLIKLNDLTDQGLSDPTANHRH